MKTEHTPGPWKYVRQSKSINWLDLMLTTEDDAKIIGWIYNDHEADARLIAAAPEMLESLISILQERIEEYKQAYQGYRGGAYTYYADDIKIVEKATGKTWAEIKEAGE